MLRLPRWGRVPNLALAEWTTPAYRPMLPGPPLNGPTIRAAIQPPYKLPSCAVAGSSSTQQASTSAGLKATWPRMAAKGGVAPR